jgi:hypothetical protein
MPSPYNQLHDEANTYTIDVEAPIVSRNIGSTSNPNEMENTLDEPVKITIVSNF